MAGVEFLPGRLSHASRGPGPCYAFVAKGSGSRPPPHRGTSYKDCNDRARPKVVTLTSATQWLDEDRFGSKSAVPLTSSARQIYLRLYVLP